MIRSSRALAVLCLVFAIAGCKHKRLPPAGACIPRDAGASDGGDAGDDAGTTDAGTMDAGVDAGTDAGADAGVDAGEDAGVDAGDDAGLVEDAGEDAGVVEDAGVTDAGTTVDSGTLADAGTTDAGSTETDSGTVDTDAGLPLCPEDTTTDAGICANILCRSNADCCDGTRCFSDALPDCPFCDLAAVSSCATSSPCTLGQATCISQGTDGTCSCPSGPKYVCEPTCLGVGCPADFVCNQLTQLCDPLPCSSGYICPDWATCVSGSSGVTHGCVAKTCLDDSDCGGAASCVSGTCQAFTGTCQYR
jgi:hypothetical protein